jgi:membrane fusion protein, heavy metal efflux system
MKWHQVLKTLVTVLVLAGIGAGLYFTQERWLPRARQWWAQLNKPGTAEPATETTEATVSTVKILLTDQAITNLGLVAKPVKPEIFWKTIQVPGLIVDRPGRSDRGIVSPITGVVTKINFFPGDTVRSQDVLFTIRLLSETIHQTQSELFKATQDLKLAQAQKKRLQEASGALPESRMIEVENQLTRLEVTIKATQRELQNRGLTPAQIEGIAQGQFVNEINILTPAQSVDSKPLATVSDLIQVSRSTHPSQPVPTFEVQELKVELGQQVQAGQTLCLLANHQLLAIEGRAFRDETPLLERSVKEKWPVAVDFLEEPSAGWGKIKQAFRIRQLANTIDPVNRTFAFVVPLENESRVIEDEGKTQILWRFRPGQKVRIMVRVEKLDNVLVLPTEAVAKSDSEAFVFTQNVNTFEKKPVRVLYQDRQHMVIANDGVLVPGTYVAQSGAAQLNRMSKSQTSGVPKGYHIHADGSLHKNEDEGK